ncbi:hypothetical protein [Spirilliplanes yamanashiensis]|uniref:hypothetical protein n=1 Tax=Spirilliplanes yamanashiensis TaxID=42233 RepID=UPI00194F0A70|nr:hypothetical protein [Spirilliplanes yamanashiensis]MDP9815741.1 hypothetical protein [Spirilliplanes yamanashiensis]
MRLEHGGDVLAGERARANSAAADLAGLLAGYSSGALLALHAAAAGLAVRRLALFEPPLADDTAAQRAFTAGLRARTG